MTAPPSRRPWWRRKRWIATALLWLVAIYPLGVGPLGYAVGRGWVAPPLAEAYVGPLNLADGSPPVRALQRHARWWAEVGSRHAASD